MIWLALVGAALAAPVTLDDARAIAVERALSVERARAEADAARADAADALGGALPSIAGFGYASTGAGQTSFGFPRPATVQTGLGLSGSWSVIDPASWSAAAAARRSAAGADAMARWAMVSAREDATVAFAAAVAAEEQAAALDRAATDADSAAEAISALVAAGLRPPADAAQARAEAAAVRARRATAEGERAASCAALQGLLRLEISGTCELVAPSFPAPGSGPVEHPALAAFKAALAAQQARRSAAWWDRAPALSADGTVGQYATSESDPGIGWSAGVDLTVPLVNGGRGAAAIRAERFREDAAAAELTEQKQSLRIAAVSAEARLAAAREGLLAQEEAARAASQAFELVDERYRAGLAGITDWLGARRAQEEASVGLARAHAALGEATAAVEAARGVW